MAVEWPTHFSSEAVRQGFGGGRLSSYTIALEAWRRGLTVTFLDAGLRRYRISDGQRTVSMNDSRPSSITRRSDYQKLLNKWDTKRLLEAEGVPVPRGVLLKTAETDEGALRGYAEDLGYPLVIKPNAGTMGQGVLTGIESWDRLQAGYRHLVDDLGASTIVLEQHYEGEDFRLLVIGSRVVAACQRIPANVEGDGVSTVAELITSKNAARRRNPFLSKGLIRVDYEVEQSLAAQGLALDDVPADGRHVPVRRIANASAGGDVVDVTDELPDAIREAAVQAVQAVPNIVIAGVDVLYQTGLEATPETFTVIEMNSRPHLGVNMYPTSGVGRDAPKAYIDHLFPDSARAGDEGDALVSFDVDQMIPLLRSGIAASVQIAAIPEHRYAVRRQFTYQDPDRTWRLRKAQRDRLQRLAREHKAAGRLYRDGSTVKLIVAAGDVESIERLRRFCERAAGAETVSEAESSVWHGAVIAGFRISPRMLSTA